MRRMGTFVLTVALVALVAGPVAAQERRRGGAGQRGQGGGFGGAGVAQLLDNEDVQKELKLDAGQVEKAKAVATKVREKHQDEFAKLRDADQAERRTKMAALTSTVNDETMKGLADVLKPEQTKRLKQIELQQAGVRGFTRADVQTALKLTAEQKEKLTKISEDMARDQRELFGGGNAEGMREKMAALRKETMDKAAAVLTADQRTTWKDLTGEPFEVRMGGQRRRQDR